MSIYTFAVALIFLIKLRLGQDINLIDYIDRRYGEDTKKLFRLYECSRKKFSKCRLDLNFLIKCKTYNVFPKFLRFKLYKKSLTNSSFYRTWQTKLLNHEINFKKKCVRKLDIDISAYKSDLSSSVSFFDRILIFRRIDDFIRNFERKTNLTHDRKLSNLGIQNDIAPVDPKKVVFNYSSRYISERQRTLLAFGLDFSLPVYKLNFYSFFLKFETIVDRLSKLPCDQFRDFKERLQFLSFKYFYNFKSSKVFSSVIGSGDIKCLKDLASDREIIVSRPDKGRGIVILDRVTYINKMLNIIADRDKFQLLPEAIDVYTRKIEDKINNFLRKIKNAFTVDYKTLLATGSAPGILYGLPKIHKHDFNTKFQLRPIFAAYNNPCFKIAKFLVPHLSFLTTSELTVENSRSFLDGLKQFDNKANKLFMTSYDIESLYTNLPLRECINIVLQYIFKSPSDVFLGLTRALFENLLELCVLYSFFIFDGKLYKQTEGLGMGLPLAPTFANIFLTHHERIWLEQCPQDFAPVFYKRYIDDTFVLFRDEAHASLFLDFINGRHPNISFTMEKENNGSISFLDTKIGRDSRNNFSSSVYRKPTFSGLGISFFSFIPFRFKVNSIYTLLHRAYHVSSSYLNFHEEINFLSGFFCNNGYPKHLFDSCVSKFLNKKYDNLATQPELSLDQDFFFSLPYFGVQSEKLKTELLCLMEKYFPSIKFRAILTNRFTIGSLFQHKDKLPDHMRSSIIYSYGCPQCGSRYVGSSSRNFYIRVREHAGLSYRTGVPLSCPSQSSIRDHATSCGVPVVSKDFSILGNVSSNLIELRILESLYIHKLKPPLNSTVSAYPLKVVR